MNHHHHSCPHSSDRCRCGARIRSLTANHPDLEVREAGQILGRAVDRHLEQALAPTVDITDEPLSLDLRARFGRREHLSPGTRAELEPKDEPTEIKLWLLGTDQEVSR